AGAAGPVRAGHGRCRDPAHPRLRHRDHGSGRWHRHARLHDRRQRLARWRPAHPPAVDDHDGRRAGDAARVRRVAGTGHGASVLQRQVLRPAAVEHALHAGAAARPGARPRAHRPAASRAPPLPRGVGELPPRHRRTSAAGRGARGRPAGLPGPGRVAVLPARRQRRATAQGGRAQRPGPAQPLRPPGPLPRPRPGRRSAAPGVPARDPLTGAPAGASCLARRPRATAPPGTASWARGRDAGRPRMEAQRPIWPPAIASAILPTTTAQEAGMSPGISSPGRWRTVAPWLIAVLATTAHAQDPDLPPVEWPDIPAHAADADGFAPPRWRVEHAVAGRLDADEREDLLLVLRMDDPANVIVHDGPGESPFDSNPRMLV